MKMRNKSIQLFIFSFMGILKLSAQQSDIYTHKLSNYDKALSLYKDKQYQSAQILFDKVKSNVSEQDVQADCAYYIANCAIRLDQMGADVLVESFVEDYPTSTKTNQAYIEVAHYYFDQGKLVCLSMIFDMTRARKDKHKVCVTMTEAARQ